MTRWCFVVQLTALVLFGLMAGFFYAFSVTVMPGLDQAEPVTAINAMNAINSAVRNPVFFFTFFVTPFIAGAAAVISHASGQKQTAWLIGGAAIFYLLAVVAPTATVNVPMNEALALLDSSNNHDQAAINWAEYSYRWTAWNTLRSGFSTVCLIVVAWSLAPKLLQMKQL